MTTADLLIVGAGPAGMAAAVQAGALGLDVVVVDEQPAPGGQIWRGVETVAASPRGAVLGAAYREGLEAAARFRASGARYLAGAQLWSLEPGFRAFVTQAGQASVLRARTVILATGAQERPVPFPGWTLPGVLTVGAAQILLKTSGQIPRAPVWVAGSGPLPLLYLVQLLESGGQIAGYLDTTPRGRLARVLPHVPAALGALGDIAKGLGWMRRLRRAGVPVVTSVADVEALGSGRLDGIRYRTAAGAAVSVPAELLLVHEGVIPSLHVPLSLGCAVAWRDDQDCFAPVLDQWGESSVAGVYVAGDGAGIGGARAAVQRGQLAALGCAARLDRPVPAGVAAAVRRRLARALAARPLLDALFRPRPTIVAPADETIVCRCEELTAGDIRAAAGAAGAGGLGPNQLKAFTRAGMGPCQGRQCGQTITRILAAAGGRPLDEVGSFRIRPPLKPVTLGELASLDEADAA